MKVWEGKQVIGFLLTWRLLWHQLQQQTTDKYNRFQVVTLYAMLQGCMKYPMLKESKEIKNSYNTVDLRHLSLMSKESKVHSIYNLDSNSKYLWIRTKFDLKAWFTLNYSKLWIKTSNESHFELDTS